MADDDDMHLLDDRAPGRARSHQAHHSTKTSDGTLSRDRCRCRYRASPAKKKVVETKNDESR
jgi:hypothetical protein